MTQLETFGMRLKYARHKKNLTLEQIAEIMEKAGRGVISQWERDVAKPKADQIPTLCEILDISSDWLLSGKEYYKQPNGTINITNEDFIEYLQFKTNKQSAEISQLKNIEVVSVG
jgi:transcriptional regulator with XRE-family HTH domain